MQYSFDWSFHKVNSDMAELTSLIYLSTQASKLQHDDTQLKKWIGEHIPIAPARMTVGNCRLRMGVMI